MKRICNWLLTLVMACAVLTLFAGCGIFDPDSNSAGGSAKGAADIEITDPVFGFIPADEYDPDTFDMANAGRWTDLAVDTQYFLFITFDVTARRDNNGQSLLNVDFTFDALNILEGRMEDVSTGLVQNMTFTDAETGNLGKTTTVSFKIPDQSANSKTINIIVSLTPVTVGESHIIIGYRYDPSVSDSPGQSASDYKLLGSDGYTKNLKIKAVKIETPVLSVTEMGSLTWQNVKNADYYCIYESGVDQPLTNSEGNVIYIQAEGVSVGGEMVYNVGEFVTGYHALVIRAFNNNKDFLTSDYSNAVEHFW